MFMLALEFDSMRVGHAYYGRGSDVRVEMRFAAVVLIGRCELREDLGSVRRHVRFGDVILAWVRWNLRGVRVIGRCLCVCVTLRQVKRHKLDGEVECAKLDSKDVLVNEVVSLTRSE